MKKILASIIVCMLMIACSVEPQPLDYGIDACYTCKMTLMDPKFGAEIVTKKGKVYKFDDMNCMLSFHHSGIEPEENMAYRLVIDFANPETLIDATNSYYVKSDSIRSPMASGIAAFNDEKEFNNIRKKYKGILMSWGEVITQFK